MRRLQWTRSCASSPDNSLSDNFFSMLSNHLRFGLALLLFPGTYISITRLPILILFSIHAHTTSTYTFLHFLDILSTFVFLLIRSFLLLSSLVTPLTHLIILISATSNFFPCPFFTAHVSAPYIIKCYHSITYFNNVVKQTNNILANKLHYIVFKALDSKNSVIVNNNRAYSSITFIVKLM